MEESKTIQIPAKGNFSLNKVKMLKDGGLDVHYEVTEVIGTESYRNHYHLDSAKDVHPDLRALFDNLRPIMGRMFNITSFLSMIEAKEFKATKEQQNKARDFADEALKNIEVRGIALSGSDDNLGVILTGLFTVSNNLKTAINTPRIKLSSVSFGFEEELEAIVSDIENEVYEFLFHGKKAQLELFDGNCEPTEEATGDLPWNK